MRRSLGQIVVSESRMFPPRIHVVGSFVMRVGAISNSAPVQWVSHAVPGSVVDDEVQPKTRPVRF
jgi:hypothetical protein